MTLKLAIEIAVLPTATNTDRGRILEQLARRLLESQNYSVTEEVRFTGMEVDLLAESRDTGERILVECKGQRSTISSEVISKLIGNVLLRNVECGWLISTFALGKDAKGTREEWGRRPPAERRKLQIYDPERLVRRLVSAGLIVDPISLERPKSFRFSDDALLMLTPFGEFWALPTLDSDTGIQQASFLYDAKSGGRIFSDRHLATVADTDTSLADLDWIGETGDDRRQISAHLADELQSIVRVPVADSWSDYRPARPGDFVGREQLQREVFDFFSKVQSKATRTRIIAIKAPSGWGKSSFVLKVSAQASNLRNKGKTFVFAVDARAASSKRYGELAIFSAFKEAFKVGFLREPANFSFGNIANPFSTDAMRVVISQLSSEGKVICLIFDQFEELLYKPELEPAFGEINKLCNSVDEAQENVVIGFSWKTDGTIPTEHNAYHLWHNLADRRIELELSPFDKAEISTALNRFTRELDQPLMPQLRRLLQDHCQGYPWLLKKLCIHVAELIRSGMEQSDILGRSLSIQDLFHKDINRLSPSEHSCIKQISQEAPAEYFRIIDAYGQGVVNSLLGKRLIIRSGPRLNVYWDIFREYVLTEKPPFIPVNYIPQGALLSYLAAVHLLQKKRRLQYAELAAELGVVKGTAENIIRDMVMLGHAEAHRRAEVVVALQDSEQAVAQVFLRFCQAHVVYRKILHDVGPGGEFSIGTLGDAVRRSLRPSFTEKLYEQYRQKLLRWFMSVGLMEKQGSRYVLHQVTDIKVLDDPEGRNYVRGGANLFLADAPPPKSIAALDAARSERATREDLERLYGRNCIRALINLGVLDNSAMPLASASASTSSSDIVREAAANSATITFVREFLTVNQMPHGSEIGAAVADYFGIEWSKGSMQRCGSALRSWALWFDGREQVGRGRGRRARKVRKVRAAVNMGPPKTLGRKPKLAPEQQRMALERYAAGHTLSEIAEEFGVNIASIWRLKSRAN